MSAVELLKKEQEILEAEYQLKLQELQDEIEDAGWGDLDWLKAKTNIKSSEKLQEQLLYPFRQELEGKIIRYGARGRPYIINKKPMLEWLEKNFERVWN